MILSRPVSFRSARKCIERLAVSFEMHPCIFYFFYAFSLLEKAVFDRLDQKKKIAQTQDLF